MKNGFSGRLLVFLACAILSHLFFLAIGEPKPDDSPFTIFAEIFGVALGILEVWKFLSSKD